MSKRLNTIFAFAGAASTVAMSTSALAQQDEPQDSVVIQEIVVTAQKRSEDIQKVPIALTVISGDQLGEQGIRRAEDLSMGVPNLQVSQPLGQGLPVFSLRGVSMSDFSLSQNGPIAIYYDEVYKGNWAIMGLGFFDLERLEVLKGPQGTLYGKNTTGGAINFIARKPSFETGGYLSAGFGNYDRYSAEGALETALSDTLGARIAFTMDRADGTLKNVYPGAPDANSTRQHGIRTSFRFKPNDIVDVTLRASTTFQNPRAYGIPGIPGPDGVGGPITTLFGVPGDFRTGLDRREIESPEIRRQDFRTHAVAVNADIRLTDAFTLTSISSWDQGTMRVNEESDGTPLSLGDHRYYGRTKQIAQDLRLTSEFDGPFNFIIGAFYGDEQIWNNTDLRFLMDIDVNDDGAIDAQDCLDGGFFIACNYFNRFKQEKRSIAAYSDLTYDATDRLTLRGGVRYTRDKGELRDFFAQLRAPDQTPLFNVIPGSATDPFATTSMDFKDNDVSGKIGFDYDLSDTAMLYASYSRGYRGAAFNAQAFFSPAELSIAEPEELQAVEVGFKTDLFDRRMRFNGSAFWYEYENQQVLDVDPATTVQTLVNLPKSRIVGAELDAEIRATDYLGVSVAVGYTDSEVRKGSSQGIDISGNRLISTPRLTLSSAVDWSIPLGQWGSADMRVDAAYASKQHYDLLNRPSTTEDSYWLMNSRVRIHPDDDRYGVALWVKNLTDTFYRTNRIDITENFGYIYNHVNEPRTYGVTFDVKF
ncbi:MAG: TonB-dependent receptor [Steroidobacteraceae bacterium]|nr:TonB-dependent receptor [Steroidobacteraceae bacterium]